MASKATLSGKPADEKMPIYERIAWELRKKILQGDYEVGSKLPIEKELCEQFGVSRHTVREALRLLRQENLISSNKKAGTVVTPHTAPASTFLHALSVDDLLTFSYQWKFTTKDVGMTLLDDEIRDWAGQGGGEEWLKIHGTAHYDIAREPECWVTYYVHRSCAAVRDFLDGDVEPILPLIEKVCDVTVIELEQEVSAIVLPREIATALHAEDEIPAMNVRRICRAVGGKVVLIADEIYPASRFKYRFSLHREAA